MEELKEYIAYSRAHCKPELTDEAAAALVEGYLAMRAMGVSRKVAPGLPLAQAHAAAPARHANMA